MSEIRQDFVNLKNNTRVTLYPAPDNPLHSEPVNAIFSNGYFYCDGSAAEDGPDYYLGDVLKFNVGYAIAPSA